MSEHFVVEFPDGPRSRLDQVLQQLLQSAQEVLVTQGRLRSLLKASQVVADELDLAVVLERIVEAAVELVGARYGAIGVIAPDGSLEQFIHVGMPDHLVEVIGHLPEGHGVLGALVQEQQPIRLEHLADDPRSSGFPAGHPPMDSFLGVPVRVRGEVYGNLYLTEQSTGSFSEEDQQLLSALAATAGAAIDHARLFDESKRRQRWSAASAEVTAAMLSDDAEYSLSILAERVVNLADADLVCVTVPIAGRMLIEVARGDISHRFQGVIFDPSGTIVASAFEGRQPILSDIESSSEVDPLLALGPTMAVPLTSSDDPMGVLTVTRVPGRARFTIADLEMVADFAAQAGVALRLAAAQQNTQRLALLEDRGRIARDLHDHVIQRLFGAGLSLQALAGATADSAVRGKITEQVDALDAAIAEIRTAIFTLTAQSESRAASLRHRVIDVLTETAGLFADAPQLSFAGAVDLMVPTALADHVVAVVREGLSNVARHAQATRTTVSLSVANGLLEVVIEDDGRGMPVPPPPRSSGTRNLESRALEVAGTFTLTARQPHGTVLTFTAPLGEEPRS